MAKATIRQRVVAFHTRVKGNLRFVSGKWFYKDKEIKDIKQYIICSDPTIDTVKECQDYLDFFVAMYGESTKWPESSIIREARERKTLAPLCFPLNTQQLKIIRKLVDNDDELMFICTGVGGSGKSTFLNIIKQIFDNDVSSCALSDLSGYNIAEAVKHRLIAADELSSDELDNKTLKTIISKQLIQVNPKFERPYQVQCQSAIFYCCNNPPRIDIDDSGLLRRIVYYSMNEPIKNPDLSLNHRVWSRDDLVNIVAHALAIDMTDWRRDFDEDTHRYLLKDNSVYIYRKEDLYENYSELCRKSGMKPFSRPRWDTIRELIKTWEADEVNSLPTFEELCEEIENQL